MIMNPFYNIPAKWVFSLCLNIFSDGKCTSLEKRYSIGFEAMDFEVIQTLGSNPSAILTSSVSFGSYLGLCFLICEARK